MGQQRGDRGRRAAGTWARTHQTLWMLMGPEVPQGDEVVWGKHAPCPSHHTHITAVMIHCPHVPNPILKPEPLLTQPEPNIDAYTPASLPTKHKQG